jgi:hypothetical protein
MPANGFSLDGMTGIELRDALKVWKTILTVWPTLYLYGGSLVAC